MSGNLVQRLCTDKRTREFDVSLEACIPFTNLLPGNCISLSSGYEVIVFGVAPTCCGECKIAPCTKRKKKGTPALWVENTETGELFECKEDLLPDAVA
ncbi:hypothetical protein HOD82_02415 [bacterium]|nr:hypothetical protein [bacterium]MBT4598023.1 hypothetical protein [bacterium]